LVRAAHNRSLDQNSERLWSKMESEPIRFEVQIDVPATANRQGRRTKLAERFSRVNLRTPSRFDNREPFQVDAVYATEIDCPQGETP
ncbi:MAG: IS4 family transposase, partial [Cyanobacteria bacterium P01_C01_bin.72]